MASVDRANKLMTLRVDGKPYTTSFEPKRGQGISFDKMRFGYGKNKNEIYIDDLAVFDYAIDENEVAVLMQGDVINQTFPKNGDKANPKGVNVSWTYAGDKSDLTFVLAYATDEAFSDRKFIETKGTSAVIKGLKDQATYFWKVGYLKNGKMFFPWDSFTTFKADSTIEDVDVMINERKLRSATTRSRKS